MQDQSNLKETKFTRGALASLADKYGSTDTRQNLTRWAMETFSIPKSAIKSIRPNAVVYVINDH